MNEELFKKDNYKRLVQSNCYNTLRYLIEENLDFAVISFTNVIEFTPPVPTSVVEFDESALFMIAGYSKESSLLEKEYFQFEAGFGESAFGSTLQIPLEAILQIVVGEEIMHISYYEPIKVDIVEANSMEALLNNPENRKFLSKKITKK